MSKQLSDLALDVVRAEGTVEIDRGAITGPVDAWLDDLLATAEDEGLDLTWTLHGDTLRLVDIEA